MLSSLDPASLSFLRGLDQIQQRSQKAQRELTTGLKINTISDDPDQISNLWQVRANLDQAKQDEANLNRIKTEVDTAEGALQSAVSLVQRAETLGSQGDSSTSTSDVRQTLADELGSILEQLVSTANTSVEGRYIFSGDSDQVAPYSIDLTQSPPISSYQGTAATRQIRHPAGALFSVDKTAQDIFDSPNASQNVFVSLNNLRTALLNNDQAGIDSALGDVRTADRYLNSQLSFYGTVQNRITSGLNFSQNYETQLQVELSNIQDADMTQSITELQQSQVQQQAALVSRSQIPRTSLFDYLA